MRDKDNKILEEKYESLYSGKIEEEGDTSLDAIQNKDDDKDKEKDEKKDEEKKETSEDSEDKDSEDKDSEDKDSEDKDSEDKKDDSKDSEESDSEDSESESESEAGGDAGIQSKIKQLQKQYNDLLIDAFEKYAAECIENALEGVESSFGENIQTILDNALQELKSKILGDLGVEDSVAISPMGGGMGAGMGGGMEIDLGDKPDVEFGPKVGGIPTITSDNNSESEDESEESENDVEEEACGMKNSKKKKVKDKSVVKESTKVAEFYGFV